MIDALLLDWEDVLVETRGLRREALAEAFWNRGLPFDNDAYATLCADRDVHMAVTNMLAHSNRRDGALADLVAHDAHSLFTSKLRRAITLVPHVQTFIEHAQSETRLAVLTQASRDETAAVLSRAGLADIFTVIVCGEDADLQNPFDLTMERLSGVRALATRRCVGMFAHDHSLRAARAAGLRTVAVNAAAHVAVTADAAVHSFDGLTTSALARLAGISVGERT